jgi:hypothetical protein
VSSSDAQGTGGGPTEEEVREYVDKLRAAPAEQILAEMLYTALNAAQVKLGRKDARLFIDCTALMHQRLRDYLPADIVTQVDQAIGQLRLAQVQAEREVAAGEPEANDLDRMPTAIVARDDEAAPPAAGSEPSSGTQTAGSKLWVPGRDL